MGCSVGFDHLASEGVVKLPSCESIVPTLYADALT